MLHSDLVFMFPLLFLAVIGKGVMICIVNISICIYISDQTLQDGGVAFVVLLIHASGLLERILFGAAER